MQLSLVVAGLALIAVLASKTQEDGTPVAVDAVDLGGPLVVGGVEIPQDEIKRFLIYGPGRAELEFHRVQALIEREIERRIREGSSSREDLEVAEEDFRAALEAEAAKFERANPTLDQETEIRRAHRSRPWYEREKRQEMQFDLVFINDDPEKWPAVTYEALTNAASDILVQDLRESWLRRSTELDVRRADWQAKIDAGDLASGPEPEISPLDRNYRSILRGILLDHLYRGIDCQTATEGLPPEHVCTIDFDLDGDPEVVLFTEAMWPAVRDTITANEVWQARRFLALIEASRQRLARERMLMGSSEAVARMNERKWDLYPGSMSPMGRGSMLMMYGRDFPSPEARAAYAQVVESYYKAVEQKVEMPAGGELPTVLRVRLDRAEAIHCLAKVDAEVLLVSAFDFRRSRWKPDGWRSAKEKADRIALRIRVAPDEWGELLDNYGELWDPPGAGEGASMSVLGGPIRNGGRIGPCPYIPLTVALSEGVFSQFLYGRLLTDGIFFDQPVGTIGGPHEGPWGYYLVKVLKRTPPIRPLDLSEVRHLELLRDDWIRTSFIEYAHEALRNTEVVGLDEQ